MAGAPPDWAQPPPLRARPRGGPPPPHRHSEIDWDRTIRANLRHYQPDHRTVIPERLVGHGRRRRSLAAELILCLDQSGSMAASVVHAGVLGASLASLPTLQTKVIALDTAGGGPAHEARGPARG